MTRPLLAGILLITTCNTPQPAAWSLRCGSAWWHVVRQHSAPLQFWIASDAQSILALRDLDGDGTDDVWSLRGESPMANCVTTMKCKPDERWITLTVINGKTKNAMLHKEWCGGIILKAGWTSPAPLPFAVVQRLFDGTENAVVVQPKPR